jgi:hypothetical protein
MRCAQCSATQLSACTADGLGSACLPSGACGCLTDADCGGRSCNVAGNSCPNPSADLAVAVSVDGSSSPPTVHITVSNKGPASAPSGTQLLIALPSGGTIAQLQASGGWRCSATTNGTLCSYNRPLAAGSDAPEVQLMVAATGSGGQSAASLSIVATVSSNVVSDPNPSNNSVTQDLAAGGYRISGGGLGCSLAPAQRSGSLFGGLAMAIGLLLFLARRRSAWRTGGRSGAGQV